MTAGAVLRVGTRASALAREQTAIVCRLLGDAEPDVRTEAVPILTEGDRDRVTPLRALGGAGVFTDALQSALIERRIDVAVHSLKDLPVGETEGLVLAAICRRDDARDVLVTRGRTPLSALPAQARVGTCSTRRTSQLLAVRPDLRIGDVRGNVETRLRKVDAGEFDAIVLAAAGLRRLGREAAISEYLSLDEFLPAPGQGAIAVQCRTDDAETRAMLAPLDDPDARCATDAERAFLGALGGGCAAPVGAFACVERNAARERLVMRGLVASLDGRTIVRVAGTGDVQRGAALGAELATAARERGAVALLS